MSTDNQVRRAPLDVGAEGVLLQLRRAPGQQVDTESRLRQEPRDVAVVLVGEDLGRRHERHLQAVLHGDNRREQGNDGLAGADVALQQPVHRLRAQHVVDDFLDRLALPRRQLERQDLRRAGADAVVDRRYKRLQLGARRVTPPGVPHLEQEELLEDQPPLRRGAKGVERIDRRLVGWKV